MNNILPINISNSFPFLFLFSHTHPNKFCNMCLSTARQSSHDDNDLKHEGRDFGLCGVVGYSSFGSVSVCLPSIHKVLSVIPVSWEMTVISALRW